MEVTADIIFLFLSSVSNDLFIYLFIYVFIYLFTYLFIVTSMGCKLKYVGPTESTKIP